MKTMFKENQVTTSPRTQAFAQLSEGGRSTMKKVISILLLVTMLMGLCASSLAEDGVATIIAYNKQLRSCVDEMLGGCLDSYDKLEVEVTPLVGAIHYYYEIQRDFTRASIQYFYAVDELTHEDMSFYENLYKSTLQGVAASEKMEFETWEKYLNGEISADEYVEYIKVLYYSDDSSEATE